MEDREDLRAYLEAVCECQRRIINMAHVARRMYSFFETVRLERNSMPKSVIMFVEEMQSEGVFGMLLEAIDSAARRTNTIICVDLEEDDRWED